MQSENKILETKIKQENRRADKKALRILILLTLAGAVLGFMAGVASVLLQDAYASVAHTCMSVMTIAAPYGNFVFTTIVLMIGIHWLRKSRKLYEAWDGEDEDVINEVEYMLSKAIALTSVNVIVGFFFFGLGTYVSNSESIPKADTIIMLVIAVLGLAYETVSMTVLQKNLVNFTKEINPEKRGSVYDMNFQEKWIESCDESEKLQTYKAGYHAMQTGSYTCIALWVVCMIGMTSWNFGIMPMVMVLLVWLSMVIRCNVEAIRISKAERGTLRKAED